MPEEQESAHITETAMKEIITGELGPINERLDGIEKTLGDHSRRFDSLDEKLAGDGARIADAEQRIEELDANGTKWSQGQNAELLQAVAAFAGDAKTGRDSLRQTLEGVRSLMDTSIELQNTGNERISELSQTLTGQQTQMDNQRADIDRNTRNIADIEERARLQLAVVKENKAQLASVASTVEEIAAGQVKLVAWGERMGALVQSATKRTRQTGGVSAIGVIISIVILFLNALFDLGIPINLF